MPTLFSIFLSDCACLNHGLSTFKSATNSSLFYKDPVKGSHTVYFPIFCTKRFPPSPSENLFDDLWPAILLFQQITG